MINHILTGLLCLLLFPTVSFSDTVVLRNGNTIEGLIVNQTDSFVTIEVPTGKLTLNKADISETILSADSERRKMEENYDRIRIDAQKEALEERRKEALRQPKADEVAPDNEADAYVEEQEPDIPDKDYEIESFSIREVNRKRYWHRLYWELKMRNYSDQPQIISARIQFFDARNVLIDEVILDGILLRAEPDLVTYTDYVRAAGLNEFSGYLYLDAYIARYVASALITVDDSDDRFRTRYPVLEQEPY